MFDLTQQKPYAVTKDGKDYIDPIDAYGVKVLSIGFFIRLIGILKIIQL